MRSAVFRRLSSGRPAPWSAPSEKAQSQPRKRRATGSALQLHLIRFDNFSDECAELRFIVRGIQRANEPFSEHRQPLTRYCPRLCARCGPYRVDKSRVLLLKPLGGLLYLFGESFVRGDLAAQILRLSSYNNILD
jgi:hypothetical protein